MNKFFVSTLAICAATAALAAPASTVLAHSEKEVPYIFPQDDDVPTETTPTLKVPELSEVFTASQILTGTDESLEVTPDEEEEAVGPTLMEQANAAWVSFWATYNIELEKRLKAAEEVRGVEEVTPQPVIIED